MTSKLAFLAVSLVTTGCFIEVDAPSIVLERPCDRTADCTFSGVPDVIQAQVPLALANGAYEIDIDLGEEGILESEYGIGPFSLDSRLTLNALNVTTLDGIVLDGMHSLEIQRSDGAVIAGYTPDGLGSVHGNELLLVGNGDVNLLDLGMKFSIRFVASGRAPASDWMAHLAFHVGLNARAQ